ncbi:hypothetical protein [Nocardiopsis alba]
MSGLLRLLPLVGAMKAGVPDGAPGGGGRLLPLVGAMKAST